MSGTLDTDGPLNTQYRVEFFGNVSGTQDLANGEARYYLGTTTVTVDGSGDGSFTNVVLNGVSLADGDFVTATATRIDNPGSVSTDDLDAYGDTSEFAANFAVLSEQAPIAVDDRSALDFDGVDDYVAVTTDPSLEITNTLTVEAWIRPESLNPGYTIIVNKEGEYEVGLTATGTLAWAVANTDPGWAWHDTGYAVNLNEWTHIAFSYDNGLAKAYVNGNLIDSYSGSGAIGDQYPVLNELRDRRSIQQSGQPIFRRPN